MALTAERIEALMVLEQTKEIYLMVYTRGGGKRLLVHRCFYTGETVERASNLNPPDEGWPQTVSVRLQSHTHVFYQVMLHRENSDYARWGPILVKWTAKPPKITTTSTPRKQWIASHGRR